jgi:hypothetical protein
VRAYHRVDPLMDERKGHYTPAQFGAFLKVQLLAGRQGNRGRFRSEAMLRNLLPASYLRHVDFLFTEGDIIPQPDGTLYVDGWDEWQEGDLTVKDRMARLRDRKRNAAVTGTVTDTVTPTVTLASPTASANARANADFDGEGSGEGLPSLTPEAIAVLERATGSTAYAAGDKQLQEFDRLVGTHGLDAVARAFDGIRKGKAMTARQLVWGAVKVLEPIPDGKQAAAADREQSNAAANERRVLQTLKQNHGLGGHAKPHPRCPLCQETAA